MTPRVVPNCARFTRLAEVANRFLGRMTEHALGQSTDRAPQSSLIACHTALATTVAPSSV
jgi:hypothetical protein